MKIPKKLKIMGETVDIKLVNPVEIDGDNGASDPENCQILISSKAHKAKHFQILCHEILHYCNALLGYQKRAYDKEEYVDQLSGLLNQIIPQLIQ